MRQLDIGDSRTYYAGKADATKMIEHVSDVRAAVFDNWVNQVVADGKTGLAAATYMGNFLKQAAGADYKDPVTGEDVKPYAELEAEVERFNRKVYTSDSFSVDYDHVDVNYMFYWVDDNKQMRATSFSIETHWNVQFTAEKDYPSRTTGSGQDRIVPAKMAVDCKMNYMKKKWHFKTQCVHSV